MKRFFLTTGLLLGTVVLASAQVDDTVSQVRNTSLLSVIAAAGWILIPLALASIVAFTLIIYCFFTLTVKSITTPELLERMEPFFENEDLEERPQATARLVDRMLLFLERHPDATPEAISAVGEVEGNRIAAMLNQRVLYIMDIGVLAPLLGLMGTVVGILSSFGHIADSNASSMRTMMLAGGVSQALVSHRGHGVLFLFPRPGRASDFHPRIGGHAADAGAHPAQPSPSPVAPTLRRAR
jgi:biopolymer transport protein ExbB/TolQ